MDNLADAVKVNVLLLGAEGQPLQLRSDFTEPSLLEDDSNRHA
jgi:hypothetical protein